MSFSFSCQDPTERASGVAAAARAVASGQLVVIPTDTLYGIGADAFDSQAVAALLAAKGRGRSMPVPVLVGSWDTLDGLVNFVPTRVRTLVEAFWPGGLTLVVEHAPSLAWDLGDARGTVAVRMPLHPVALELLALTGPMAVSSANKSGFAPAATVAQAQEQLGESVGVYLDGGLIENSLPSTIVDVTAEVPKVLRQGAVSLERLRAVSPDIVG
ncbi:MAG: Sua5/YciO/YrdC/YwlC family protein [Pseudonocardiales bacterium]|nr:Sua5/YciO/YrdC/YwlC family protein [Pseudonocardiales bacterium]